MYWEDRNGEKVTANQDELELKHTVRKIYLSLGIFLLSGILFAIGMTLGANSTLEIILCLPTCVLGIVILLGLALGAKEFAKEKGIQEEQKSFVHFLLLWRCLLLTLVRLGLLEI